MKKQQKYLLGVGFDRKDETERVTQGENYHLYGGSKETHEQMQEHAVKFNEELNKKHKDMNNISREEFNEIADKVGMQVIQPVPPKLHSRN